MTYILQFGDADLRGFLPFSLDIIRENHYPHHARVWERTDYPRFIYWCIIRGKYEVQFQWRRKGQRWAGQHYISWEDEPAATE